MLGEPSPFLNAQSKLHFQVNAMLRAYEKEDPPRNARPSLPMIYFEEILKRLQQAYNKNDEFTISLCELILLAVLCGLRSCEYVTTNDNKPLSERLRASDIAFKFVGPIHNQSSLQIEHADMVLFTFRNQKNANKQQTISRPKATHQDIKGFCPVTIAAKLKKRLSSYNLNDPHINITRQISNPHKTYEITYNDLTSFQKAIATYLGAASLGFAPDLVSSHCNRITFATYLYNAGFPDAMIKAEGRWDSDAFLRYIRSNSTRNQFNVTSAITSNTNQTYIIN